MRDVYMKLPADLCNYMHGKGQGLTPSTLLTLGWLNSLFGWKPETTVSKYQICSLFGWKLSTVEGRLRGLAELGFITIDSQCTVTGVNMEAGIEGLADYESYPF